MIGVCLRILYLEYIQYDCVCQRHFLLISRPKWIRAGDAVSSFAFGFVIELNRIVYILKSIDLRLLIDHMMNLGAIGALYWEHEPWERWSGKVVQGSIKQSTDLHTNVRFKYGQRHLISAIFAFP